MFGINLTLFQKLEVAFICIILGIAGVFVFWSTRPAFDRTISTFPLPTRHHASNNAPVTAANPVDPIKDETVIVFACSDGQLMITQFPNDPSRHPQLKWNPEKRQPGLVYHYYQDPMAPIATFKDPFRHALAYATYNTIYGRALHLLANVDLTPDQITKEAAARDLMINEIKLIDGQVDGGTYFPNLMDNVMKALAAYNAKPGDPQKDNAKADLAHKVLDAVTVFIRQEETDKNKFIDKYMSVMEKLLSDVQKQKLIDAYNSVTQPRATVTPRRGPAPGAAGGLRGTGVGTRGGAAGGTRGTRGTTAPAAGG